MTNMTLALPDDLHKIMRKHSEIKWSEVARKALWEQARKVELMDEIAAHSKLTQEDAHAISKMIKKDMAKRHGL